ncbi:EthD family reductase [Agromyces sp. NPDC049794]|uniref:EthD family reductase n=1 Tax=unclassified Agromyces TaxID=2639701 RepID=UPI0033C30FFE
MDEIKLSLIIDNPSRPIAFESRFPALLDLAGTLPGLLRIETARVFPSADGSPAPAHRTVDLYFASYGAASRATGTPEAATFFEGLTGTGGTFIRLLSHVETHGRATSVTEDGDERAPHAA